MYTEDLNDLKESIESVISESTTWSELTGDIKKFTHVYKRVASSVKEWRKVAEILGDADIYVEYFHRDFEELTWSITDDKIEKSDIEDTVQEMLYASIFSIEDLKNKEFHDLKKWAVAVYIEILKKAKVKTI